MGSLATLTAGIEPPLRRWVNVFTAVQLNPEKHKEEVIKAAAAAAPDMDIEFEWLSDLADKKLEDGLKAEKGKTIWENPIYLDRFARKMKGWRGVTAHNLARLDDYYAARFEALQEAIPGEVEFSHENAVSLLEHCSDLIRDYFKAAAKERVEFVVAALANEKNVVEPSSGTAGQGSLQNHASDTAGAVS